MLTLFQTGLCSDTTRVGRDPRLVESRFPVQRVVVNQTISPLQRVEASPNECTDQTDEHARHSKNEK